MGKYLLCAEEQSDCEGSCASTDQPVAFRERRQFRNSRHTQHVRRQDQFSRCTREADQPKWE